MKIYKDFVLFSQVDLNTMTNVQCSSPPILWGSLEPGTLITDNMICASDAGKSACGGDNGGPLVTNEGKYYSVIGRNIITMDLILLGSYYFVGLVSWGTFACAVDNYPNVYSRVTSQLLWIKKHISGTTCPRPIF